MTLKGVPLVSLLWRLGLPPTGQIPPAELAMPFLEPLTQGWALSGGQRQPSLRTTAPASEPKR